MRLPWGHDAVEQSTNGTRNPTVADLVAAIEAKEKPPARRESVWSRLHEFVNDDGAETPGTDADQGESV
jgi:hypothetical protein